MYQCFCRVMFGPFLSELDELRQILRVGFGTYTTMPSVKCISGVDWTFRPCETVELLRPYEHVRS